jgi:hypothetical protein
VNDMEPTEGTPQALAAARTTTTPTQWDDLADIKRIILAVCGAWLRVLSAPSVATFTAEIPEASWERIGVGLGLTAAAWATRDVLLGNVDRAVGSGIFHAALALLVSGVLYVAARVVARGTSTFKTQTHLYVLYHAPLSCTLAVIGLAPAFGGIATVVAAPLLSLYGLILSYLMLRAAHAIGRGRAAMAMLTLLLVIVATALLVVLFLIAVTAAIASLVSHL